MSTKIRYLGAGHANVSKRSNVHGNQGGGSKKGGISTSSLVSSSTLLKSRTYQSRAQQSRVYFINQIGGIGGTISKRHASGADGVRKI